MRLGGMVARHRLHAMDLGQSVALSPTLIRTLIHTRMISASTEIEMKDGDEDDDED